MIPIERSEQVIPILTFSLGSRPCALLVDDVVEVAAMVELMPVTDARPEFLGVVNRHGLVLPMLDLRLILGQEKHPITVTTMFIVAAAGTRQIGLVVDEVQQVEYIPTDQWQTSHAAGKFIRGIISYRSVLMQIIDPSALMDTYLTGQTQS